MRSTYESNLYESVSTFVASHPGCSPSEVAAGVPMIRGGVPVILRKLERAGFIQRDRRSGTYQSITTYPLALAGTAA